MNKSDLKDGMHVKLRDRSLREYYKGYFIGVEYKEHLYIDSYDIDLKNNQNDRLDIVKVFNENNNTIWEREKEEKEIDWSKILVGTNVLVSDTKMNWFYGLFLKKVERDNKSQFRVANQCGDVEYWGYCKLAEELKEEVTFSDIDKEMKKYCKEHNKRCSKRCDTCGIRYISDNYNVTRKDNK